MAAPTGAISNFTPITAPTGAELLPAVYAGTAANYNVTGNVFRTWLLASSTLTGVPTAPTATQNTNTTQVASTAFVLGQATGATPLMDGTAAVGTTTLFARGDHVHPTDTTRAPLASPALTGTPTVPTAAQDTNTTQAASTAFVVAQAGSANPLVNGAVAVGTSLRYARQDHVHPTDTTRAAAGANSDITSLSGLTTALSVAQGGTGEAGVAWTVYTPTVTAGAGLFTTASATGRYKRIGKVVYVQIAITITTVGTASVSVNATLPIAASASANNQILAGRETASTGKGVTFTIVTADTKGQAYFYDNTFPGASGNVIYITGVYEGA